MSRSRSQLATPFLILASVSLTLAHCKPKESQPAPAEKPATASPTGSPALNAQAQRLPFAALLTQDTEFFLGTVGMKNHLVALHKSVWWKDANALIHDKTPAPDTSNLSLEALKKLWGDDFFIAGGPGFATHLTALRDLNRFYSELNFRVLMTGAGTGLQDGLGNANPLAVLQPVFNSPASLARLKNLISGLEIPPLLLGIQTENAAQRLNEILPPDLLAVWEKNHFAISDHAVPNGPLFKTLAADLSAFISKELEDRTLAGLPPETPAESRRLLSEIFSTLRTKRCHLAWGAVDNRIFFAAGKNLEHLKFAMAQDASLLARPELAPLQNHLDKNLLAISYINRQTLLALHDDEPFAPMLRGVVSAMQEHPSFGPAGNVLASQMDELSALEKAAFARQATDFTSAVWWDSGLCGETCGGIIPSFLQTGKPLRFAPLLNQEKLLFGITYHANPAQNLAVRTWVEKFFGVLYTGAKEFIKAGVAGPESQQQLAFFEMLLLPTLQKIYQADKDISQKGMGDESAVIIDMAGTPPVLPGIVGDTPGAAFPRLTTVNAISSRTEIAKGWSAIEDTLNGIAAIIGATSGAPPGGSSPIPLVEKSERNGFTTWAYKSDLLQADLTPNSTLNDQFLILSTSRPAAEKVVDLLAQPPAEPLEGCLWQFNISALAEFIATTSASLPGQTTEKLQGIEQNRRWIEPFKTLQGHLFFKEQQWRSSFDWEIQDIESFD